MTDQNGNTEKRYLTAHEVVAHYDGALTIGGLSVWRCRGQGPAYLKLGKKVVYPLTALIEWEAAQVRAPLTHDGAIGEEGGGEQG